MSSASNVIIDQYYQGFYKYIKTVAKELTVFWQPVLMRGNDSKCEQSADGKPGERDFFGG